MSTRIQHGTWDDRTYRPDELEALIAHTPATWHLPSGIQLNIAQLVAGAYPITREPTFVPQAEVEDPIEEEVGSWGHFYFLIVLGNYWDVVLTDSFGLAPTSAEHDHIVPFVVEPGMSSDPWNMPSRESAGGSFQPAASPNTGIAKALSPVTKHERYMALLRNSSILRMHRRLPRDMILAREQPRTWKSIWLVLPIYRCNGCFLCL